MSMVSYEYSTKFRFPFPIKNEKDFQRRYSVDRQSIFNVQDNDEDSSCIFTLYSKVEARNPASHDPTNYEKYAQDMRRFYNITRLAITYLTGCLITGGNTARLGSRVSEFYYLPKIEHNFYENAKKAGLNIQRKGRAGFTSGAYLCGQLSPEKLRLLQRIIRNVKLEVNCVKFDILDLYFKGFIDRVDPFYHWHQIVEIMQNPEIGFIDSKLEELSIENQKVDMKFLRLCSGMHRHAKYHKYSIGNRAELINDPIRSKFIQTPEKAKSHYQKNLKIMVEYYLLNF